MMRSISAVLVLLVWVLPAVGATLPGRVLWVTEGDTLVVLGPGNAQHKVRLAGIDAPELNPPYGNACKDYLSQRVAGRFVVVEWEKRERYKRIIEKLLLGEQDVCLEQVRAGLLCSMSVLAGEQTRQFHEYVPGQGLQIGTETRGAATTSRLGHGRAGNEILARIQTGIYGG